MSSSVYIDYKGRDILIHGEEPTQGLDGTTFTAEAKYPLDFRQYGKRFVLSLLIMEATFFCLLMLQKYISLKQETVFR